MTDFLNEAKQLFSYSQSMRRDFHMHPELGFQEVRTAGIVADHLRRLGLEATFAPINDIAVNGRKISGNAQTRRFGGVLQHGTVLCDVNPALMFTLLKVPDAKLRDKLLQTVAERVTSIRREVGAVDPQAVIEALCAGFAAALDAEFIPGVLTEQEAQLAQQIKEER